MFNITKGNPLFNHFPFSWEPHMKLVLNHYIITSRNIYSLGTKGSEYDWHNVCRGRYLHIYNVVHALNINDYRGSVGQLKGDSSVLCIFFLDHFLLVKQKINLLGTS